jgi:hypothetical protein
VSPKRLEFHAVGLVSEETYISYAQINLASGVPVIRQAPVHGTPLAIVGGGPSARRALAELQDWPGHIWAINQGATWLSEVAPKAMVWMFTVDPGVELAGWTKGVERALLGTSVHPKLIEALRGKEVRLFHTREVKGVAMANPENPPSGLKPAKTSLFGPSSVCRVFYPALLLGYLDVTLFGCEGSFEDQSHAYRDETNERPRQMIVRCGEEDCLTTPDFYMTTQFVANVMRHYPKLKEKSGGLLRGMLEHWDTWEVVAMSEALRDQVDPQATEPYVRAA